MKKRSAAIVVAALAFISLMLAACIIDPDMNFQGEYFGDRAWFRVSTDPATGEEAMELFSGRLEERGTGYSGGFVFIDVTFEGGVISEVDFRLFGQTPAYVGRNGIRIVNGIGPWIVSRNALDFPGNIVSGATVTGSGLRAAADRLVQNNNLVLVAPGAE